MQLLVLIIGAAIAALTTALLQKQGISTVVAASLVGLCGAAAGYLLADQQLPLAVFAGAFVGMTAPQLLSLPAIVVAGAVVGGLMSLQLFVGYGGRAGAMAFVGVLCAVLLAKI